MEFNDNLLKAISWTLVHSVWQGFLLALFAGIVILLTGKSSAALRYNLLSTLFLIFIAVTAITFSHEFHEENVEVTTTINLPDTAQSVISQAPVFHSTIDILGTANNFLNANARIIALIWLIVLLANLLKVCSGLGYVYRIRNYKTYTPSDYCTDQLDALAKQINLNAKVLLLESGIVKVPSVVGFFKPVILIPFGLLASLPQDQVEAVLLHELAHIKREDYLINILQSLAEVVFFFNPGVLWLSSLLRDERENCCDDIAIAVTNDKKRFVTALVAFEAYNVADTKLAMGFFNHKNNLLGRATRIIYSSNKSLNVVEKTFLGLGLAMATVFAIACSNGRFAATQNLHEDSNEGVATDVRARQADVEAARFVKEQAEKDRAIAVQSDDAARQADLDAKQADEQAHNIDLQVAKSKASTDAVHTSTTKTVETSVRTVDSKTKTEHSLLTEKRITDSNGSKKVSIFTGITGDDLPDNIDAHQLTLDVISDLISENIISNTNNLSYNLSNKSLIVNNVVQPAAKYQKLKEKYLASAKVYAICYNYELSGMNN